MPDLGKQHGYIDPEILNRLHASSVIDEGEIVRLLEDVRRSGVALVGRRTVKGDAESARVRSIAQGEISLECQHVGVDLGSNLFLTFALEGRSYFFAVSVLRAREGLVFAAVPKVVYVAERRDRRRVATTGSVDVPRNVVLDATDAGWTAEGTVQDYSPVGLYVESPGLQVSAVDAKVRVKYLDGAQRGTERWGVVRHSHPAERPGWVRLGVATSEVPFSAPIAVEKRNLVSSGSRVARARNEIAFLSAGVSVASDRVLRRVLAGAPELPTIEVVEFANRSGELIRGILDRSDRRVGGTAVVIPPAWGRTKETLLPLAATIVQTFKRCNESVSVLRFDGTRRRGESHKDRGFEAPGLEHIPFRFSHAVDDILTSSRYLVENPRIQASRVILITFSAASIEGRRSMVMDRGETLSGWVSVVGTPDLQSGMRTVSGGIDFVAGVEQGLMFGQQEIMGVATDVDALIGEALNLRLAFLEDARRDMVSISSPVTWIHGANDAWLDLSRVRDVMGSGSVSRRRLIEVPTGHQLRSSKEALQVFMLVAEECARMTTGNQVSGAIPRLSELDRRREAERARLAAPRNDNRAFWKAYLLGRGDLLGIELMNATRAYDGLMAAQIAGLHLTPGSVVADVGAGTGSFLLALLDSVNAQYPLTVDELDYVPEAFIRAKKRLAGRDLSKVSPRFIECDLDNPRDLEQTFGHVRYDAVLMSLVLSYVRDPLRVLKAIASSMRPGARLVASTLQRDADISRLYMESVDELRAGRAREVLGADAEAMLDESVRTFLNDMARVLDLEEQGVFRFLDSDEIVELARKAGLVDIETLRAFGDPPQAVVVTARKPGERRAS